MNVFDAIERHARATPAAAAVIDGDRVLSFAQLEAAVCHASSILEAQGIRQGDVVGISIEDSLPHLLVALSLARSGAASVYFHPEHPVRDPGSRRNALADRFGIAAVVSRKSDAAIDGYRLVLVDAALGRQFPDSQAPFSPSVSANDHPWRIRLTSGTTGIPKGIAQYHARFVRICALRAQEMGLTENSRLLCRMSICSAPMLNRAMAQLLAGGAIVFHGGDQLDMFNAIERHRVTHAYVSPEMLRRWLSAYPSSRRPLAGLRHLEVGGGRLSTQLGNDAMARITPHLYVGYGSTESGAIARADPEMLRREPTSVGRVVPWAEVQVVDDLGRPLLAGETGMIRIRGEEVATGYFGGGTEASGTAKGFRDGWFYPGDFCRLTRDGLLYVEDRADDVVNLGGPKVNAREIEDALANHPAITEVAVFGATVGKGARVLVAAVVPRGDFDERALRQYLKARGVRDRLRILPTRELPRNAMGKVLKQELASRVKIRPPERPGGTGEE